MKHLLFFLLLAFAANAHAQCDQFDNLLKKGDAYLKGKKPNYQEAINAYTAAILACSDRAGEAQRSLAKMVSDINQLKENAVAEKKYADIARQRADSLYEVANAERKRAEAVLNKIYFYNGRFGLASEERYGSRYYGFIDKQLNAKIDFQYWEALPFDNTGYAKVKKDNRYYLIDTIGAEFWLATDLSQLVPNVLALDLQNKNISQIPATVFSQTPQLKVLLLAYNQLSDLSAAIGQLNNLQSLDVSSNKLSDLSAAIGQLNNLQSLDVSSNQLRGLPAAIGQLNNLQSLDVSRNELFTLPSEVGQLNNLRSLDVSHNQLRGLPAAIGQLNNLQSLDVSRNELFTLPSEVGQLQNLQSLDISSNQLSSLPAEVGQLQNLQSLDISSNQLSSLPAEIGQWKNLRSLDLSFNYRFHTLPPEIRNLKSLKQLDLQGNHFSLEYIEQLRKDMPWCEIRF